jgi:hypothetical protein
MPVLLAEKEFARAISAAFVADVEAAPILKEAVASGAIGPRRLRDMMLRAIESEISGRAGVPTFPNLRKLAREQIRVQGRTRSFGMGVTEAPASTSYDWIMSAAGAVTSIANAFISYQTGKKLIELEKEKTAAYLRSQELLARQAELDAARARLAYSKEAEAEAKAGPLSIAGLPGWAVPAAGAAAVVGILLLRG